MGKCWGITKNLSFCKNDAGDKKLCHIHKSQPKYVLITVSATILLSYLATLIPSPLKRQDDQNIHKKLDQIITQNKSMSDAQKAMILQNAKRLEEKQLARLREKYELGYAVLYIDGSNWYYVPRGMKRKFDWFSTKIHSITKDIIRIQFPTMMFDNDSLYVSPVIGIERKVGSVCTAFDTPTIKILVECLEVSGNSTSILIGITQKQ